MIPKKKDIFKFSSLPNRVNSFIFTGYTVCTLQNKSTVSFIDALENKLFYTMVHVKLLILAKS